MQRRSIPSAAVELILDFAEWTPAGGGAQRYRFTNKSWACAAAHLGARAKEYEKYRNAYVIEASDGTIVTAAWLY